MNNVNCAETASNYGLKYMQSGGELLVYIPTVRAQGYWTSYDDWFKQRETLRRELARDSIVNIETFGKTGGEARSAPHLQYGLDHKIVTMEEARAARARYWKRTGKDLKKLNCFKLEAHFL